MHLCKRPHNNIPKGKEILRILLHVLKNLIYCSYVILINYRGKDLAEQDMLEMGPSGTEEW